MNDKKNENLQVPATFLRKFIIFTTFSLILPTMAISLSLPINVLNVDTNNIPLMLIISIPSVILGFTFRIYVKYLIDDPEKYDKNPNSFKAQIKYNLKLEFLRNYTLFGMIFGFTIAIEAGIFAKILFVHSILQLIFWGVIGCLAVPFIMTIIFTLIQIKQDPNNQAFLM